MKFPFNTGDRKVQLGVAAIVVLLVVGLATKCHSSESYTQFGVGSTVVRGETTVLDLAYVYPNFVQDAALEVGVTFIGPSTYRVSQPNNFIWRGALVDGFGHFDVGLGMALVQNEDSYNSGRFNFVLMLGYRFQAWPVTLALRHFSNGGTKAPNVGRDMLVASWRFE